MDKYGFNFDTTYTNLPAQLFTELAPEHVKAPYLAILNNELAESLGLNFEKADNTELASILSGNTILKTSKPFAQAYAGHQFGHFNFLGDGRAHILGEHITPEGKRFDIQLKGSGRTPYSRSGDGKATLGPMLREYIISEAMFNLGIPTTRSLAVVTTSEDVMREEPLQGAILTRVAASHIRIGTFQLAATSKDSKVLSELLDYTINRHHPELESAENPALALLNAVMEKQIDLVCNWLRVGFIHGVSNTDNVTLSGETIDYGPCAFMDSYDPHTVFSSIDHTGRYAYANQAPITQWNIARLAEALLPLIDEDTDTAIKKAEEVINKFPSIYKNKWLTMMSAKLGLEKFEQGDEELVLELLTWMKENHADYTNTFKDLSHLEIPNGDIYEQDSFKTWFKKWQNRLQLNNITREQAAGIMRVNNPAVIPRNHNVENALQAANDGDLKPLEKLLEALRYPYKESELSKLYQSPPPADARVYQTFCGT